MRSSWRRGAAVACLLTAWAGHARAEPTASELATARQLFAEGVALEDTKDWKGALERFRRVNAIKATPQVRYNLGVCLANTGHLVEAANQLGPLADLAGDPDLLALASLARQKLAQLRPRIPRLLVALPPAAEASVTLDGTEVSSALLGAPMLVDPGPHTIVAARLSGGGRVEMHVVAVEGATSPVVARIELGPEASEPSPPGNASPGAHRRIPAAAYVAGGVTVAALSTALVLALLRSSAISTLDAACGAGRQFCPPSLHGKVNDVGTFSIAADVLTVVGVLSAGATGAFVLFAPSVVPGPAGTAFGISALGRF